MVFYSISYIDTKSNQIGYCIKLTNLEICIVGLVLILIPTSMLSYPLSITLVFATKFSFLLMLLQNSTVSALNTNPDGSTLTKEQHLQLQQQKRRYNCEVSKHHIYIQARRSNSKQLKLRTHQSCYPSLI